TWKTTYPSPKGEGFTDPLSGTLKLQSAKLEDILNIGVLNKTMINLLQDPLTHLPNWQQLQKDLKSHPPAKFALLNIRSFSDYNLTFGLPMGDKILLVTGQVLASLESKIERAYHLYADIFALFLPKDQTVDYLQLVQTIQDQLNAQTSQDFHIELYLSYCEHCHDPLPKAQYGLIEAKKLQQTAVDSSTISQGLMATVQKHLSWKQKVEMAMNDARMIAVYQPLLNLRSNKVDKYECLMRIENEDSSLASPAEFMPVLEKMFLYHEGTARMLQFAFHTFSQRPEQFSINLSHSDIKNPNLLPMLERLANTYPGTAQKCVVEFLETEELIESKSFSTFLQQCKTLNIQTAIDDFGTGYSNFKYLFSLPIDFIKLDGSLTQNMHDPKIYTLCKHTTKMAHEMGMQVVAEFVSSGEILDKVRSLEIDYAQGYQIGKPEKMLLMPQIFS
ncbi:MAG: bifunctional diguanylate cyclase/phosphodiesterase, partial [Mariprofundus sp.]|nr:bifunctional diguanylate cyclase/phosphodiesterase [Mariprofundus sp.]